MLTGLTLLTRPECELCESLREELAQFASTRPLPPLRVIDIDTDVLLRRRYGLHIPVLLLDGAEVCRHRLDTAELERLLRR